jgi:flagellum-specific peptidoglycan hydrolase FlgJ
MKNTRKNLKGLLACIAALLVLCSFAATAFTRGANVTEAKVTQAQKDFISQVSALVAADTQQSGILASLSIAQAIHESNWGTSGLTMKANALFGIKADSRWKGRVYNIATQECYDGVNFTTETAAFRAYDSWKDSIADHSAFLKASARYAAVIGEKDYAKACNALQKAGYATDPSYARKLIWFIETYGLTAYDTISPPTTSGAFETYTVVKGDTLWKIAKKKLGKGARYPEIKSLNGLTSDIIRVGQKLKLPK